jgi:hypothetical protein
VWRGEKKNPFVCPRVRDPDVRGSWPRFGIQRRSWPRTYIYVATAVVDT